jgi:hypothetical protein
MSVALSLYMNPFFFLMITEGITMRNPLKKNPITYEYLYHPPYEMSGIIRDLMCVG